MIANAVMLLMICVFAFIPLLMGEYARNRSIHTTEDFILHGRKITIFPMYATVFGTWMSVFVFMGGIAYFYEMGPIFMTAVGWDMVFALMFVVIGRRIWHYGKMNGYMTATDFFDDIYDSKALNLMVTGITIICTLLYLQAQIVGGVLVLHIATDGVISWQVGGIIFFAILDIYLWAGGLRAVALTDIFYSLLIIVTILSSGFFLMKTAGGQEHVFQQLIQQDPLNVSIGMENRGERAVMWISLCLIVSVGAFMGPQMWIRNYAAASERNFNVLPLLLCLSSIIFLGTLFAGSASMTLAEDVTNPDSILLVLIRRYGNQFFYAFIIVGIYASIFSTANSQVHALASVYTIDVHKRYINRKASDRKLVSIAKAAVLFVSLVSYVLIIVMPQSIFDLVVMALGGAIHLIVPTIGALFWKRSTARAAIAGLIAGEGFFLAAVVMQVADGSICALLSLGVNILLFITVALADRPRFTVYKKIETYKQDYLKRGY